MSMETTKPPLMNVTNAIGNAVTQLREKHELSVKELHALADVSVETILLIENGHVLPRNATLVKLLKAMNEEELSI